MKSSFSKNLLSSRTLSTLFIALLLMLSSSYSLIVSADETVIIRCVVTDLECFGPDPGGGGGPAPNPNPGPAPGPVVGGPGPSVPAPTPTEPEPEETQEECLDRVEIEQSSCITTANSIFAAGGLECLLFFEVPFVLGACLAAMSIANQLDLHQCTVNFVTARRACNN